MYDWNNLRGLIPIVGGFYLLLLAQGVLPRSTKVPEQWARWREKYGVMIYILSPFLILAGALQLCGYF